MRLVCCTTRKSGTDRSKAGKDNKPEKQSIQEKGNPSRKKRQTDILVKPLSKWWEILCGSQECVGGFVKGT